MRELYNERMRWPDNCVQCDMACVRVSGSFVSSPPQLHGSLAPSGSFHLGRHAKSQIIETWLIRIEADLDRDALNDTSEVAARIVGR